MGIELYAPRQPRHRRTWTAAALVLAIVFIIAGQIAGAIPGVMLGYLSPQGDAIGWQGTAFTLASFAFIAGLVILWVRLFERRGLAAIGFNRSGLKRFLRGYAIGLAFLVVVVGIIWGLALAGIVLKLVFGHRYKILRVIVYLAMGWLIVFAAAELTTQVSELGVRLTVIGGVVYTLGVVFYLADRLPYNHAIWHLFVVGGSLCHFYAIYYAVLPHGSL